MSDLDYSEKFSDMPEWMQWALVCFFSKEGDNRAASWDEVSSRIGEDKKMVVHVEVNGVTVDAENFFVERLRKSFYDAVARTADDLVATKIAELGNVEDELTEFVEDLQRKLRKKYDVPKDEW